jgi:lipopolysaccharide/colanic/teichoic acid biosynthesis glycosyltransferase
MSARLYRSCGKRLLDLILSSAALLGLFPVLLAVGVVVRLRLGAPVWFVQARPGAGGRSFNLVKFRTMTSQCDALGVPLPDAERVTPVGRFLRSSSLDELPELWNVLVGDMSLVGPRPLLMQYLGRYTPEEARRHEVRPGVTGLAQVSGRNALSWKRKFELDVEYVDRSSLALDLDILARTVWQVVARRDINQPGHATAEEFMGHAS